MILKFQFKLKVETDSTLLFFYFILIVVIIVVEKYKVIEKLVVNKPAQADNWLLPVTTGFI